MIIIKYIRLSVNKDEENNCLCLSMISKKLKKKLFNELIKQIKIQFLSYRNRK